MEDPAYPLGVKRMSRTLPAALFMVATLVALATTAHAAEPYKVNGGWWTCPAGYVIRSGQCLDSAELAGPQVIVSDLPSAGEGAPGTCPSGGCAAPAPAPRRAKSGSYETASGWFYRPSTSPNFGGTLSRSSIGGTTIISLPRPW